MANDYYQISVHDLEREIYINGIFNVYQFEYNIQLKKHKNNDSKT